NGSALTLTIAPTALPGSYPMTVRGRGTDIPDATVSLTLTVLRASVAISVSAQTVSVFPAGPSATSTVAITRTSFAHGVSLTIEGAPPGLSATTDQSVATGNSATITVAATGTIVLGQYTLTV